MSSSQFVLWSWIHLLFCVSMVTSWYGEAYYNDRYGGQGIAYDSVDRTYGLWSDEGGLHSNYLLNNGYWSGEDCSGCTCNDAAGVITSCTGSTVSIRGKSMVNITAGTFSETTTSITIINCPNFQLFEDETFVNLTSLQELVVQGTALNHVPDLSTTAVTKVNLAGNVISLSTDNHRGWRWPTTIQYLAMMDNLLYWLPENFVDGPNLRIASFGNNQLLQIHPTIFGDTSSLIYLGMDGNRISRLSRNSIAALATSNFQHLNISNNEIVFIQAGTFDQLSNLKILEVHGNLLPTISVNVFSNMPELLHLDLHANGISALPRKSFENLPKLMELRLHSQKTPMTSIAYDAWTNIGDELINLFVSQNGLSTYPHQVLEEGSYPKLERIFADNNAISNVTEYGSEAFPTSQKFLYSQKRLTFTPFAAYPALHTLYLHANLITHIESDDFCNMTNLQNLYINRNLLTEDNIDDDAFQCLPVLDLLQMGSNLIQYVPNALKSSTVLPALTELYMQNNHITFLETGTFTNLSTLSTLILTENKIVAIENNVFNADIEYLKLDGNEFRFTHQFPFSNLQNMKLLWLSSNVIDYIPPSAFANCTSLIEIQMAYNNIAQLLKSHFENCPLSGDILFNDNDIGYIEDGTFDHVTSMTRFTVANNVLTRLPNGGDFADLSIIDAGDTLQGTLDFSNNRLVFLETNTFVNLAVADYLSLANNKITKLLRKHLTDCQPHT
ncbi:leucine-rich repeat-containing protein 15-like [Mercenaria mercenaria]|uniref:leucine-rich repeat-containing protein 15-like n=1 Tax=Mercenaria mercenaria TaxID=6596 RepID=UPI00234F4FC1|nr:leucine-rich repeat-containing protein 15-like [Mercenaria mercenaria]XP_053385196.1 leucine-rich repeat-containing protein 15-like [Mercenaria mercenaria]